jgi:hypothetical protein
MLPYVEEVAPELPEGNGIEKKCHASLRHQT